MHMLASALLVLSSTLIAYSRRCNEGINATVYGIPLYHWDERDCIGASSCFTQEIGIGQNTPVSIRYGGCISGAYANLLSCKVLFSNDSNLNPAIFLDLVTDSDDFIEKMSEDFRKNLTKYSKQLFGMQSNDFIEGVFDFNTKIGLNMKVARKLKQPISNYFSTMLEFPGIAPGNLKNYYSRLRSKEYELYIAIGNLKASTSETIDKVYSFLQGLPNAPDNVREFFKTRKHRMLLENVPGLIRSMIIKDTKALHWFDAMINALSKLDSKNLKQSVADMLVVFKKSIEVSATVKESVIQPIFDTIPDVVDGISKGSTFEQQSTSWAVSVLMKFSKKNSATNSLSLSMKRLLIAVLPPGSITTPPDLTNMIEWLPGLFYTFAPARTADIDKVYIALDQGMDSFNFTSISQSAPLETTKMSEFLIDLIQKMKPDFSDTDRLLIINFSKTYYNAMTAKYEPYLDKFFSTLITDLGQFPTMDAGMLLKDLMTNFGQEIPRELSPMLDKIQDIVNGFLQRQGPEAKVLTIIDTMRDLATEYHTEFPQSKFPTIGMRYLDLLTKLITQRARANTTHCDYDPESLQKYFECIQGAQMKMVFEMYKQGKKVSSVDVDLFFAILEATGLTSDSFIANAISDNRTLIAAYARLLKSLEPDDVKELVNDYNMWLMNIFQQSDNYDFDNFILSINYTTNKIIHKLTDVMTDVRYLQAPESCRYVTCNEDVCNTHKLIGSVTAMRKTGTRGDEANTHGVKPTPGSATPLSSRNSFHITLFMSLILVMHFIFE